VRVLVLWLWKGEEHSRRASCVVSTNTDVEVDISEIQPGLLSVDTVLEFSLPGPSIVYVGGPDADSSAVYWNVGSCRCQSTGQESPSCLSAHTWTALLGLSQLIVAVKSSGMNSVCAGPTTLRCLRIFY
jgi:hypothetical protein